jgi:hypothetical protein
MRSMIIATIPDRKRRITEELIMKKGLGFRV